MDEDQIIPENPVSSAFNLWPSIKGGCLSVSYPCPLESGLYILLYRRLLRLRWRGRIWKVVLTAKKYLSPQRSFQIWQNWESRRPWSQEEKANDFDLDHFRQLMVRDGPGLRMSSPIALTSCYCWEEKGLGLRPINWLSTAVSPGYFNQNVPWEKLLKTGFWLLGPKGSNHYHVAK